MRNIFNLTTENFDLMTKKGFKNYFDMTLKINKYILQYYTYTQLDRRGLRASWSNICSAHDGKFIKDLLDPLHIH